MLVGPFIEKMSGGDSVATDAVPRDLVRIHSG